MASSRRPLHLFSGAALLLAAWGIFAFGAEFTWAYAPLTVFAVAVGLLGVLAGSWREVRHYRAVVVALAILFGAASVQVLPLPTAVLMTISPNRANADYDKLYRTRAFLEVQDQTATPQTLSIAPNRTVLGLWFLGSLSVLLLGAAIGFSAVRPTTTVKGLMFIGLAAAMVAIIQGSAGFNEMYGFWTTRQFGHDRYGPLINRNHTAGVLIMLLALTLGYAASAVQRTRAARVNTDLRTWLLWLGSRDGRDTVVAAFGSIVIGAALVYTRSRSGLLCLIVVLVLFFWWVARQERSSWARRLAWVSAILLLVSAANVGGVDAVLRRFATEPIDTAGGRLAIWEDAARMIRDFPASGTGLNTFGVAALHYQRSPHSVLYIEAHNDYLQVAAEGGLLLTLPAGAGLFIVVALIRRRFAAGEDDIRIYWLRVGAAIGMVGIALQSVFDFTLQMPGAAALFVLLMAIAIHRPAFGRRSKADIDGVNRA